MRAQRHEAATPVGLLSLGMGAPQGAPCKRAGAAGLRATCARRGHAATAEENAVLLCVVLPGCGRTDWLAATSREAVGKLLVPATQHGAGCGVQL